MGNPVTYFEIAGKDSEKLNDFYCSVFEWTTQVNQHGGNYFIETNSEQGIQGHILPVTEDMPMENGISFYIEVDDLQAYLSKAESLGGKTVVPPQVIGENMGSFAMFLDPGGNCIGLYRQPDSLQQSDG